MSESKRYRVRQNERGDGFAVVEPDGVRVMATTLEPWQAERIARLLNAEEAVRAALADADALMGQSDDFKVRMGHIRAKVRAALSALGEG